MLFTEVSETDLFVSKNCSRQLFKVFSSCCHPEGSIPSVKLEVNTKAKKPQSLPFRRFGMGISFTLISSSSHVIILAITWVCLNYHPWSHGLKLHYSYYQQILCLLFKCKTSKNFLSILSKCCRTGSWKSSLPFNKFLWMNDNSDIYSFNRML